MLIQPDDAPEPILSTLKSLGEILTVHAGEHFMDEKMSRMEVEAFQLNTCLFSSGNDVGQRFSHLFGPIESKS